MSSGFVSGGTVDNPVERDDEWRRAQAELEAERKAKADLAAQHQGKSLFEILQENKDKKQAEFEEKARYKLHVSLDDDEADYLRELEERKRKEEQSVRKDTSDQLELFRRQQEDAEKKLLEGEGDDASKEENTIWAATGRKRKKGPETGLLKGVKLRKANSAPEENTAAKRPKEPDATKDTSSANSQVGKDTPTAIKSAEGDSGSNAKPALAPPKSVNPLLVGYASSDEE